MFLVLVVLGEGCGVVVVGVVLGLLSCVCVVWVSPAAGAWGVCVLFGCVFWLAGGLCQQPLLCSLSLGFCLLFIIFSKKKKNVFAFTVYIEFSEKFSNTPE